MSLYTCYLCEETKSKDDSPCTAYYPRFGQSDSTEEIVCEECTINEFSADLVSHLVKDKYGRIR